jgi:hypothetical protein
MPSKRDIQDFEVDEQSVRKIFSDKESDHDHEASQGMLEWVEYFLAEQNDVMAFRAAGFAAQLEDHEFGDQHISLTALAHIARIGARLDRGSDVKGALRKLRKSEEYDAVKADVEATRKVLATKPPPQPPPPAARYTHPTYGEADLLARKDDKLKLKFSDGTVRTLLERFVSLKPAG